MFGAHLPAGLPGSISWKAQLVGVPAYNLAMAAAGAPGHEGRQARFYLAMSQHQRLRSLARAAAATPPAPTA
jgi:hypothetical protein